MQKISVIFFVIAVNFVDIISTKDDFQSTLGHIKPQATPQTQQQAVEDLLKRIIPDKASLFTIEIDPSLSTGGNEDVFQLTNSAEGRVIIKATTGVTAATGLNYYLKKFCKCHISWEANQLNLPEPLPEVNVTITLNDRFRYYQNVCTTSYSFVWWNWQQWEKHIDWIVLNSFNLVLSFHGQEAIWDRVYRKLNLTDDDIDEHFSGPAFLSWLRMGNIRGWGGPLSKSWHERTLNLQKLILERMRSFGIIPVLPAFAGHLPRAFKRLYPNADMVKVDVWNNFNDTYCCPYFLDPTEELFNTIGKLYLTEQTAEFGTDHVYNCDSFNEVNPSNTDLTYLANVGKGIFKAMTDVDSDAIWLMQGWFFFHDIFFWTPKRTEALLTSVPNGKMIVLDLYSEQFPQYDRLNQYYGQPYIWCMLHNFGGVLGMFGSTDIINERPITARNSPNSTMIGIGVTPEGINQNYVVYDLMVESAWKQEPENLENWMSDYSTRRYGMKNENIEEAWKILQKSVYNFKGIERIRGKYVITTTPSLKISTWKWYESTDVLSAWDIFVNESSSFKNNSAFLHDLVDITRQILQIHGDFYYNEILEAYNKKDVASFQDAISIFMDIFQDLEDILGSNEAFLLGNWLEDAKNCGNTTEEKIQYEYNAKNQITLWGPKGEIMNYANKQWAGVVSDFFGPRWSVFINYLNQTWDGEFNQATIKQEMFETVEEPFTFSRKAYPTQPQGDTLEIAKKIHKKWWSRAGKNFSKYDKMGVVPEEEDDSPDYIHKYGGKNNMKYLLNDPEVVLMNSKHTLN